MINSFRFHITAWYLLFFSLLFAAFSAFLYHQLAIALVNRLDDNLATEVRTATALFQSELVELKGDVPSAASEAIAEIRTRGVVFAIFAGDALLATSDESAATTLHSITRSSSAPAAAVDVPGFSRSGARAALNRFSSAGRRFTLVAVSSLETVHSDLLLVRRIIYIALPLLIVIAGAGGFLLAQRSLRPLASLGLQARQITDRTLNQRLAAGSAVTELADLAAAFNELLERLDTSFDTMRRFMADASHELRTPIAIIRGEADVALAQDRDTAGYKQSLAIIHDESKRLTRLVDDLLNLARADAGHSRLQRTDLYLNDLLVECCRSVRQFAAAREVRLECDAGSADVPFRGDEDLLRRLIVNLLDNGLRYTPAGGLVTASLTRGGGTCQVRIADTGIGIAPEAAAHVFERFYRADDARSRHSGGFGLGLAIARWIVESHHGSIQLESTPGQGSVFTVSLPESA